MDAKSQQEVLGDVMSSARRNQATIERLLEALRGEIVNAHDATVAAKDAAAEVKQAATALRSASEQVAKAAATGAQGAVGPALTKAFEEASDAAAKALGRAAQPTLDKFAGFSGAAVEAEDKIRSAGKWFGWKAFALAASGVGLVWAISWGGLLWERAEYAKLVEQNKALNADIETAKANLAVLDAKGGKIKFNPDGCAGRPCIAVAENQGTADKGWRGPWVDAQGKVRYVIPKGY